MNIYFCTTCGNPADPPRCPRCGSHTVHIAGDLHLTMIGLDAYINILKHASGNYSLVIKKPSGQVDIPLQQQDLLHRPTTHSHVSADCSILTQSLTGCVEGL